MNPNKLASLLFERWHVVPAVTWALIFLLLVPWNIRAQTPSSSPPRDSSSGTAGQPDTAVYSGRDIFVPKSDDSAKEPDPVATSFADGFLRTTKHHLGFSVNAFESYTPNEYVSSTDQTGVALTSIVPSVYANVQNKRWGLRLNYGAVMSRHNQVLSYLDHVSQFGNATFSFGISHRKTSVQLTDYLTSFYNDPSTFLGASPFALLTTNPQYYMDRQRETLNDATLALHQSITKKFSVSITEQDQSFRYSGSSFTHLLTVTGGADYQLNKWIQFNIRYSHYLNYVPAGFRNTNIEHLQIAGLSFKFHNGWQISSSGGVDSTTYNSSRLITATGQAAISKVSKKTSLTLSYNRGYGTVFPSPNVLHGDSASFNVVQQLSSRIKAHANSSYFRGSVLATSAGADTVLVASGLEFLLRNNLIASTNYFIVSQKLAGSTLTGNSLHSSSVSFGLQYFLPSLSGR